MKGEDKCVYAAHHEIVLYVCIYMLDFTCYKAIHLSWGVLLLPRNDEVLNYKSLWPPGEQVLSSP